CRLQGRRAGPSAGGGAPGPGRAGGRGDRGNAPAERRAEQAVSALVIALGVLVATGVLALVTSRWPRLAAGLAAAGVVVASALGSGPALLVLRGGAAEQVRFAWAVPAGALRLGIDPLTAFFLLPLFGIGSLCAIYGV